MFGDFLGEIPSLKLTARPSKWMVGILYTFLLGFGLFSGLAAGFREGTDHSSSLIITILKKQDDFVKSRIVY